MPIIKIHNVETNEVIEREMNEEELKQWEQTQLANQSAAVIQEQKAKAKLALLDRLGITEDEAKLLFR